MEIEQIIAAAIIQIQKSESFDEFRQTSSVLEEFINSLGLVLAPKLTKEELKGLATEAKDLLKSSGNVKIKVNESKQKIYLGYSVSNSGADWYNLDEYTPFTLKQYIIWYKMRQK